MNDVNRELLDRYASFSSEELLHLAEQRDDLTAEAKGLLDLEMSRRNLSIKDIVPLEEPEPEPSPATAEADFQEIPQTSSWTTSTSRPHRLLPGDLPGSTWSHISVG
jgi:hypothetical protein